MRDSIKGRSGGDTRSGSNVLPMTESDGLDDLGAFGFLRGAHDRALMLEMRRRDGTILAFAYSWLDHADFDPSEGITLHFGGHTIKITGRNLNAEVRPQLRLFAAIVRHRVPWLREADGTTAFQAEPGVVVIDRIEENG